MRIPLTVAVLAVGIAGFLGYRAAASESPPPGDETEPIEVITPATPTPRGPRGAPGTRATGDGANDFGACRSAGRELCPEFFGGDWQSTGAPSWKLGLVACLGRHRADLDAACLDSLDRRETLNQEMVASCRGEAGSLCRGVRPQPGKEPLVDCLKENRANLSSACEKALDAHEASKPKAPTTRR